MLEHKKAPSIDGEKFNRDVAIHTLAECLGYDLKRSGNTYITHCPNCGDENNKRHLTLYPTKNFYKCHKCGEVKGNNFALVRYTLGLTNAEVYKWIEVNYDITFLKSSTSSICPTPVPPFFIAEEKFIPCRAVPELHLEIYRTFHSMLELPEKIRKYLTVSRAIPESILSQYLIKGISGNHSSIIQNLQKRFMMSDLIESGIFVRSDDRSPYFRFYDDCVVFPHFFQGKIVFFSTRNLEIKQQGKKSFPMPNIVFYNLDALNINNDIYLYEGIINGLSHLALTGKDNFVCTLGIKPNECVRMALTYPEIEFRCAYDPDKAGIHAKLGMQSKADNLIVDLAFYQRVFSEYLPVIETNDGEIRDLNDLHVSIQERYNERAGIIEYDGGLSRVDAEMAALDLVLKRKGR